MKTNIAAIVAVTLSLNTAFAAPTLTAFAGANTALVEASMITQTETVTSANVASVTSANFGCRLDCGVNGTLIVTSVKYSLTINGSPALDGLNNPITNWAITVFNPSGDSSLPDLQAFSSSGSLTRSSGNVSAGLTTPGTSKLLLEQQSVLMKGTSRRPYLSAIGNSYGVSYQVVGTFNGVAFDLSSSAQILVVATPPTIVGTGSAVGVAYFEATGDGNLEYSFDLINWSTTAPSGTVVSGSAPGVRTIALLTNPPMRGFVRVNLP